MSSSIGYCFPDTRSKIIIITLPPPHLHVWYEITGVFVHFHSIFALLMCNYKIRHSSCLPEAQVALHFWKTENIQAGKTPIQIHRRYFWHIWNSLGKLPAVCIHLLVHLHTGQQLLSIPNTPPFSLPLFYHFLATLIFQLTTTLTF